MTGLAGCNGRTRASLWPGSAPGTEPGSDATNASRDDTPTGEPGRAVSTDRYHLAGTTVLEDFEDLSAWTATSGRLQAASPTAFNGSQSLRLTAPSGAGDVSAWVGRDVDWDLQDATLSLAVNPTSPVDNLLLAVRLHAPDDQHVHTMAEFLRVRENQGWMRIDLGTRETTGSPDLSTVQRVEIGVYAASGAIDFHVDDLRRVPRPDRGAVVLSFDDALESHYSQAYSAMLPHDMPGNAGIITDHVGNDGALDVDQLDQLQAAGWELASHATRDAALTTLPPGEMERTVRTAQRWLTDHGFETGARSFVYPHGAYNDRLLDVVERHHAMGYRYLSPLSATSGRITDTHTIARGNAAYNLDLTKQTVANAEKHGTTAILAFHDIADTGGLSMSPDDFRDLVDYIDRRDVDVLTFSDLLETRLAD